MILPRTAALLVSPFIFMGACKTTIPCENANDCTNGYRCEVETGDCLANGEPSVSQTNDAATSPKIACPGSTHHCIDSAPAGWFGPMIGTRASRDEVLADCPTGFEGSTKLAYENVQEEGSCSCSCTGIAQNVECGGDASISSVSGTSDDQCYPNTEPVTTHLSLDRSCAESAFHMRNAPAIRKIYPSVVEAGSCAEPILSNTEFKSHFQDKERYCSLAPSEQEYQCSSESECLPKVSDSKYNQICIYQDGNQSCPSTFPLKELRYSAIDDKRSCSDCSCPGAKLGESCGGKIFIQTLVLPEVPPLYPNLCGTPIDFEMPKTKINEGNGCVVNPVQGTSPEKGVYVIFHPPENPVAFACEDTKTGGQVQGAATEIGEMTFCCQSTSGN